MRGRLATFSAWTVGVPGQRRIVFAWGAVLLCLLGGTLWIPLPRGDFSPSTVRSLRIVDRSGILLRECLNDGEGHARWVPLSEIAPVMVHATIAVEDRRFYVHPGADPLAIVRAVVENVRAGSLRTGGSTLTQQVIRNVHRRPRTVGHKLAEIWEALRLERMMTKDEILEQYLNRAPYGNQLVGVEAAARSYFGKPSNDLSPAEAAFLAGLPNAPSLLNPRRNPEGALARQRVVLRRLRDQGFLAEAEFRQASEQPLRFLPPESTLRAGHVTDMVLNQFQPYPTVATVTTTIDDGLQEQIQILMQSHISSLAGKNVTNGAVVVIDNASCEVRALVGSLDYFDEKHDGQVNGALAHRQPGSSIKPLMYALAMERGFLPADVVADIPTAIPDHDGDYVPENYDRKYHGPVRVRTALACSYNVPAVRVLKVVGKDLFLQRLREAGITTLTQPADFYGYGLTLGNGEITLLELTTAYAALANEGRWRPSILIRSASDAAGTLLRSAEEESALHPPRRIYDQRAVFLVTDILADPVARRPAFGSWFRFPFPCAVKTGTTKDYRDNWTMGYTTRYTVGVWVGNFDGSAMHGVSGVSGAGRIFSDVISLLHTVPTGTPPGDFPVPEGLERREVCTVSGLAPTEFCRQRILEWFPRDESPRAPCTVHRAFRVRDEEGRVATRIFDVFPSEYAGWAEGMRLPVPPAGAVQVIAGTGRPGELPESGNSFSIITPRDGDCFKIDPILRRDFQTVKVLCAVPPRFKDVRVRVDKSYELAYRPEGIRWHLQHGRHILQLVAMHADRRVESAPVEVRVE